MLDWMRSKYIEGEFCFEIGGRRMPFGVEDVISLIGLGFKGEVVRRNHEYNLGPARMDEVLGKEVRDVEGLGPIPVDSLRNKSIYLGYLRERFQTVSPDEDLENYVNAYVLYVVGTVILADSGVEVCIGYQPCIKGGAFRDYAWGAALLSHFHFYFQKKNQKHIGGCMVALMVYLFEHFPSLRDEFFRDRDGLPKFLPDTLPSVYPLCAGWAAHIKDVLQNRRNRSPVDYEALTSENNEVNTFTFN